MSETYFQLFDLPPVFDLDVELLTARYRDLQRAVHPDRYANASEKERLLSLHKASMINDGYRTLKSPLLRAKYLLQTQGVPLDDHSNTAMDARFLMEQMELRDELSELPGGQDGLRKLDQLLARIDKRIKELYATLSRVFSASQSDYNQAADAVRKVQFYLKLREEAQDKQALRHDQL